MMRLFGRIYEPSTADRGVESWIASLAATRASHSPSLENARALIALALSSLALGCGIVALCREQWVDIHRAEIQRRTLDAAFSDGWKSGREQGKRDGA